MFSPHHGVEEVNEGIGGDLDAFLPGKGLEVGHWDGLVEEHRLGTPHI